MLIEPRDLDLLGPEEEQRIDQDPRILVGKPVLRGTRVSVTQVLVLLAHTQSVKETVDELRHIYPNVTKQDVIAALRFAAVVLDRQLPDIVGFRVPQAASIEHPPR